MNFLDLYAGLAASVAGICLALRGYMLKPSFNTWADAPNAVATGLLLLSIALGAAAVSIFGPALATAREAAVYTVLAGVAAVMLWNLHRQRPAPRERRSHQDGLPWPR